ncbi:MAG: hypothetical protein PHR45_00770, partial [Muribaculaceae bacterium]|nr:hypothetical protein [Muribaculaceae bacterium]
PVVTTPTENAPTKIPTQEPKPQEGKYSPIDSYGSGNCSVDFYGTTIRVPMTRNMAISLNSLSENEISKSWDDLSSTDYQNTVNACLDAKKTVNMNDWTYLKFVKMITDKWTNGNKNESNMLAMFILVQSGYKVKVANKSGNLLLLYASASIIYGVNYLSLGNDYYYVYEDTNPNDFSYMTYPGNFSSNLKLVALNIYSPLRLKQSLTAPTRHSNGAIDLKVSVNKNLMKVYDDFPQCDYSIFLNAPVTTELRKYLLEPLKQYIAGKSKLEAANNLLNYVQRGFDYKTDDEQFGYERPLFVDESFYYPYNDCEDRSMVFATLIRELLDLDVVILEYPNHAATAVCFNETVKGDYVTYNGKKYTVCDPTCINAKVGVTMPQFRKTAPTANPYKQ